MITCFEKRFYNQIIEANKEIESAEGVVMRKKTLFNKDWKFVKYAENAADAQTAAGEAVTLPHTWNAVDGQDGGNDYYRGTCWYAKKFAKPEMTADEEVWLEFEGVAMSAEVYLNGEKLAHHEGGYSAFRMNLTDYLQDENELAVSADNGDNDRVYPQKADFTFYGGIYRNVHLIVVRKAHFSLGYKGGTGLKVTPAVTLGNEENPASAVVTVEAWAEGTENAAYYMEVMVDGLRQRTPITDGYAKIEFKLAQAHLWDGLKDPYLYTAEANLLDADENEIDKITARFGCRTIEFNPEKGFFLNGKSYPLRGVSRHQDRAGVGNALTPEMHEEDLKIIREIGANTIRLAHYQHAQYFYDLCDEQGMILWAEIPYITLHMPNGRANTLSQMTELIIQNYNHPSIVCWGLSNEISASGGVTDDLMDNHRELNELCHKLDATRPTTMAHVFMLETDSELLTIPDIGSYNLYFGWYLGDLEQNDSFFDEYHKTYPDRVIGFSEYGADANPAYHTTAPCQGDYTESYQTVYHEHMIQMIEERPYLWAAHVWNMFDFGADGRDEGGKNGQNQKGLVTIDRKLKKDAFYIYKAHWNEEPFVHICGRRYADRAEEVTEVKVYSNQPEVSLYVDGELKESQTGNHIFRFMVPISGEHEITAKTENAEVVCNDCIIVKKVTEPNPAYNSGKGGQVVNWFDKEDFKPGYFSIKDTMAAIGSHPQAGKILAQMQAMTAEGAKRHGDVAESVKDNPALQKMMATMSMESLLKQAGDMVTPEQVKALNAALQQIKKME